MEDQDAVAVGWTGPVSAEAVPVLKPEMVEELLMALRRPDVWPVGDLALAVALHEVKRLRRRPDAERQLSMSAAWAPWRSVAARLLWHYYLTTRGPRKN